MTHANDFWSPRHPDEDELVRAADGSAALRQLLAAASAPPSAAELKGQSRAIADFRAAQRLGAPAPERDARTTSRHRRSMLASAALLRSGRWSARFTVACTALVVLLGGTAATVASSGVPKAVRNLRAHWRRLPSPAKLISALPGQRGASRLSPSWGRPTA